MVKIGIIGLGHMGCYHLSASQLIKGLKLVGIADPNKKNWNKIRKKSIIKTENYLELLPYVDGVIIAVPTSLHYPIAKTCLDAGKHVLIEKPLTQTLEEADILFKIAKEKKLALHVGHVERFNAAIQEVKKIIQSPFLIECHRMGPFSPRVQNDSVILDLMIHDIDLVLDLVNSPIKKFTVFGSRIKTRTCDIATVQLEFENGTLANITSNRISHIKKRSMSIHQKNSYINLNFATQDIYICRNTSDTVQIQNNELKYKQAKLVENLFVYKDNPLKMEIEYFINAIKTKTKLQNKERDTKALKLILKIEKQLGII